MLPPIVERLAPWGALSRSIPPPILEIRTSPDALVLSCSLKLVTLHAAKAMGNRLASINVKDLLRFIGMTSRRRTAVFLKKGYAGRAFKVPVDSALRQRSPVERSVLRGFFNVVDDEDVNGAFCGFEFEAQLLLESCEERGSGVVGALLVVRRPLEVDVIVPCEAGFVHHFAGKIV